MRGGQLSFFDGQRLLLEDAIELSLESLRAYGLLYDDWVVAYSGGKDSTATVTLVVWAIKTGRVAAPASLTVLYADTRMELPPLFESAMGLLAALREDGFEARVVLPEMARRFFVYMLGRGVPPPKNRFRWCTPMLKVEPMMASLAGLREKRGKKLLMITGVRLGESAARDQRIALSCSRDSGECGQGWFQVATKEAVADTLAPLLHWRLCHVYDWLYWDVMGHGYNVDGVAEVYGEADVRTGCVGCNLVDCDTSLLRVLKLERWNHLWPLIDLKPLYRELQLPRWRKRKLQPERRKDGTWGKNVQRMGPLTMEARAMGLERVLDVQRRSGVDLVNEAEEAAIRGMWAADVWPRKWSAEDADATLAVDALRLGGDGEIVRQALLL